MSHIHLYMNNPTAGEVDGTEISSGDETLPLALDLDAAASESKTAKCAVRCDAGYALQGGALIYFEGTNADKWRLASDEGYELGDWQSALTLANVADTNVIFWVKAAATSDEEPSNDASVDIRADGVVVVKGV